MEGERIRKTKAQEGEGKKKERNVSGSVLVTSHIRRSRRLPNNPLKPL